MVDIKDRYRTLDDREDLTRIDAEHALVIASEHDGGNIGYLARLIGSTYKGAVAEAIRRGWLVKDKEDEDTVHITTRGKDYYLHHLKESTRHAPDYRDPDTSELDAAIREGKFPFLMPREHTGSYVRDTLPPPPPVRKVDED